MAIPNLTLYWAETLGAALHLLSFGCQLDPHADIVAALFLRDTKIW